MREDYDYFGLSDLEEERDRCEKAIDVLVDEGWVHERRMRGNSAYFLSHESFFGMRYLMKLFKQDYSQEKINNELKALDVCSKNDLSGFPRLFSVGKVRGVQYLILNHFNGDNVDHLVYFNGFDMKDLLPYLPQLAEDLGGLHVVDYVHKDIKPANLLLSLDGFKILDMGLAVPLNETCRKFKLLAGSPGFMSPETCRGDELTPASDIYSLGISLYEMFAGEHPFNDARTVKEVMGWQLRMMPQPLIEVAEVSQGLSDVVMKALVKDAEERFRNGKEMADALAGVC
tara:strand:- start:1122 stop:1979 length:858 start_codon:yes stop_codon:yes gene_type:complete